MRIFVKQCKSCDHRHTLAVLITVESTIDAYALAAMVESFKKTLNGLGIPVTAEDFDIQTSEFEKLYEAETIH